MTVKVAAVGGNFIASNSTPIVDLLSAPAKLRGNRLLGVNFTGMDAQNNNDRLVMALNMGKFEAAGITETGAHRSVGFTDPLAASPFMHVFATGALTGGTAAGGPVHNSHNVPLHGLVTVEQIDLLIFLPDNTTDLQWFCELIYEPVKMSASEWTMHRHRSPVEHRALGTVTV